MSVLHFIFVTLVFSCLLLNQTVCRESIEIRSETFLYSIIGIILYEQSPWRHHNVHVQLKKIYRKTWGIEAPVYWWWILLWEVTLRGRLKNCTLVLWFPFILQSSRCAISLQLCNFSRTSVFSVWSFQPVYLRVYMVTLKAVKRSMDQ